MAVERLAKITKLLLKRRDALRRSLALELALRGRDTDDAHSRDEAQDAEADVVFTVLARSEDHELAEIEYALDRIREGQYGICEVCGGAIRRSRLHALPYATSCIGCQRELERMQLRVETSAQAGSV